MEILDDDVRTLGRRVKAIRLARRKSLRVVAGLAGISASHLQRIETGQRALDSLSLITALANVLQVSPSELTRLPVPAPSNGHTDSTVEALRLVLDAIDINRPEGMALPVAALRDQVTQLHNKRRASQFAEVATELPSLIRNVHTTLAAGTDHAEVLDLAVYLHIHVTRLWLAHAGAPADLLRRTVFLIRRLAQERDEITALSAAMFTVADALLAGGAFQLGQTELAAITLPPTAAANAGLVSQVITSHALAAVLDGRPGDVTAPMETATELAQRFGAAGQTDAMGFLFGPVDAATMRMWLALETNEPDQAVTIARTVNPKQHPFPANESHYWIQYGRALARLQGRRDDAVLAFRRAEELFPTKVRRDPMVRDVLGELVSRAKRDSVGRELRGLAYRSGLPV